MFHEDGHCATDAETVYVHANPVRSMCPSVSAATGGSSTNPFCDIADAVAAAGATRRLIVIQGGSIPGGTVIQNAAPLSIVGQSAAISADTGQAGLHVSGTDVYVRGVRVSTLSAATIGIIADSGATIRLDGVDVESMPQGGLRVTDSATYSVINSIFAANGGTRDEGNRFIGGVWLLDTAPPAGSLSRFAFNTVVNNERDGVICAGASQTVDASLVANNMVGSGVADITSCTSASFTMTTADGAPNLTTTHRATATSPCVDFVQAPPVGAPDHDIDGIKRPEGTAFDCGASESPE